jgi:hypothetical protein
VFAESSGVITNCLLRGNVRKRIGGRVHEVLGHSA